MHIADLPPPPNSNTGENNQLFSFASRKKEQRWKLLSCITRVAKEAHPAGKHNMGSMCDVTMTFIQWNWTVKSNESSWCQHRAQPPNFTWKYWSHPSIVVVILLFRILLKHVATDRKLDGRPSVAADVRAPLEAVELQTGACSKGTLACVSGGEETGTGVGWERHVSQVRTDRTNSSSMSAARAGRRSEGLDKGEWAHSCRFFWFSFSAFCSLHAVRRPTRLQSVPVPTSPDFRLAGVKVQQAGEGWRRSRTNYPDNNVSAQKWLHDELRWVTADGQRHTGESTMSKEARGRGKRGHWRYSLVLTGRNVRLEGCACSRVLNWKKNL